MICMMLNIYVRLNLCIYIYVDMFAVLEDPDQQHPWQTEEPASWMFSMYVLCYFQSYVQSFVYE